MELQLQKSYDPPQKKPKEHNKAKLNTPASSTSQLSHVEIQIDQLVRRLTNSQPIVDPALHRS